MKCLDNVTEWKTICKTRLKKQNFVYFFVICCENLDGRVWADFVDHLSNSNHLKINETGQEINVCQQMQIS